MKLLKALWNKLRGIDQQAAEAIKNPVQDASLAISDAKEDAQQFEEALTNAVARRNKMQKDLKEAQEDVEKYDRIARLAVKSANDTDATEALKQKQMFSARVNTLTSEISKTEEIINTQKQRLNQFENKIENAENNKEILEVRLQGAELRDRMSKTALGNVDGLDALEEAVEHAEAKADAREEMAGAGKVDLEEKYSGNNESVENELAKLKKELVTS